MVMYISKHSARNGEKNIGKQIEDINFTKLTLIGLYGSNFSSVEGLIRMRMPLLRSLGLGRIELYLGSNNITTIKTLRKANW